MIKTIIDTAKLSIKLSLISVVFVATSFAATLKPNSFDQLKNQIRTELDGANNEDTIIVVAFDDFIFTTGASKYKNLPQSWIAIGRKAVKKLRKRARPYLSSVGQTLPKKKLRYPGMSEFVNNIADSGASLLVFSGNLSGPLGKIKSLEQWSLNLLKSYNITINFGIFADVKYEFKNLTAIDGYYPTLYNGMMSLASYGSSNSLSNVLITLFEQVNYKPKKIMLISDNLDDIDDLRTALNTYDAAILFKGYNITMPAISFENESPQEYLDLLREMVKRSNQIKREDRDEKTDNPYS